MKTHNHLSAFLIISILFFFSCATPKIVYDYDKEVNFSSYTTFDFLPEMQLYMNQLDSSRVVQQVEQVLLLKGLKRSDIPDIYVNILTEQFETPSRNSVGIGVGGTGRNVGVGVSGHIPLQSNSITQLFTVEFIDVSKNMMIWQGIYEGRIAKNLTPDAKNEYFKLTFEKIFSKYPPR